MHASAAIIGMSAFAIAALAQDGSIAFNTFPPHDVTPGNAVDLKFTAPNPSSPVTITLLRGCPGNCVPQGDLTSSATNGDFSWTPASSLATGCDYGLQISQNGKIDYSNNFCVQNSGSSSSSSSAAGSSSPAGYGSSSSTSSAAASIYSSAPVSSTATAAGASATSYAAAGPSAQTGRYSTIAGAASTPVSTPSPAGSGPKYTGAASHVQAGAGAVGLAGVAGVLAML